MNTIILAGGKGSRMNLDIPKCLVKIDENTILDYQLNYLLPFSEKVIISLGHLAGHVVDYVRTKYKLDKIDFAVEGEPKGTAGGLRLALERSNNDNILVLNSDDLTDINIDDLKSNNENTICVANPTLPFGLVKENDLGFAEFVEKPKLTEWVSCGWYFFKKSKIIDLLPETGMLEYDVFPKTNLKIHRHTGFWAPVNNPKELKFLQESGVPEKLRI